MIPMGRYRHFKGNYYEVLCLAKNSETEEQMVVYKCEKDGSLWVRPMDMFVEKVRVEGSLKPRFHFIGNLD
ncbi:DUF1653 domain-containing protein [Desulforamulus aquiferis]|uniref:DUF1653 domain-containing protein n=1 Tax=Desulforamulus aquiferis TaxID=1397668 RepID=A0AAW7ZD12_9FIRM|nr:DUF1653 domain-containing protein [Desulforamulus aquiferis]MDO7786675.1 DUF1653 domain-containing protein [Desulforamulus aquiferis]RYD06834.1 hypothetical protein N752_02195 [Desulforamulus aquiferis]